MKPTAQPHPTPKCTSSTEASTSHDNAANRNPIHIVLAIAITTPFSLASIPISRSVPIPLMFALPFSILLMHLHQSIQVFRRIRPGSKSLVTDGPHGIYCAVVASRDGDASILDVERELIGGTLGKVNMSAAAVLIVVLELPLKFLGPQP